jgi:hypothetical protein
MLILKYIDFAEPRSEQVRSLLQSAKQRLAQVEGLEFRGFYSSLQRGGYVFLLETDDFARYLEWLKLCPPPPGVAASHEVLLTLEEMGI